MASTYEDQVTMSNLWPIILRLLYFWPHFASKHLLHDLDMTSICFTPLVCLDNLNKIVIQAIRQIKINHTMCIMKKNVFKQMLRRVPRNCSLFCSILGELKATGGDVGPWSWSFPTSLDSWLVFSWAWSVVEAGEHFATLARFFWGYGLWWNVEDVVFQALCHPQARSLP